MMSLDELNLSSVEAMEDKEFGAFKTCITSLRVRSIEKITVEDKAYKEKYRVFTELVDPTSVEPANPKITPSGPIVELYVHNEGSLKMLRRFIEAHGFQWADFVGAQGNREEFLQQLVGAEAEAKCILETKHWETGEELENPRNKVRYRIAKAD